MAIEYNFKYMPLVGKLSGKSMAQQTETAINEIAKIVNDNTAQAEIINKLAEQANANSGEALEKANEALETSGRVYINETGAVDLDSYCESQLIYINNIFSQNLPVESKGFLEVKTNDDKTQATQVFIDDTNKEVYTRSGAITETTVGDVTTYTASYSAWNKAASTNYVENMVLIRQNSTAYSVGDIARSISLASYMLLECTSAGTTGASEPSYEGLDVGDVITDGSVSWTIIEYASTDYVDDSITNLKNVYLPENYLPLSGGTMTGGIITKESFFVKQDVDSSSVVFLGGKTISSGGYLGLYGKNHGSNAGRFAAVATDGSNTKIFLGQPDGTLTWVGKEIERVNASGRATSGYGYIRYESGIQICFGNTDLSTNQISYVTYPVPFISIPSVGVSIARTVYVRVFGPSQATGFSVSCSDTANDNTAKWVSIGWWK